MFKTLNAIDIGEIIDFTDVQLRIIDFYITENIKKQFKDWENKYIKTHSKEEIYDQSYKLNFYKECFHILTTYTYKFLEVKDLFLKNYMVRLLLKNDNLMYYLKYLYLMFLDDIGSEFVSYEFMSYYLYEFNEPDKLLSTKSLIKILNDNN